MGRVAVLPQSAAGLTKAGSEAMAAGLGRSKGLGSSSRAALEGSEAPQATWGSQRSTPSLCHAWPVNSAIGALPVLLPRLSR